MSPFEVFFNHKNNLSKNNRAIIRTSLETTKTIRQIRNLLQNDAWTKYYNDVDIKRKIVSDLIYTNETLMDIKSKYLVSLD